MARCSVGGRTSAIPTTVRGPSLYAVAATSLWVREITVTNTTATAVAVGLGIASAAGTQGAGLTEVCEDDPGRTILGTGFNTHTADATISATTRHISLSAAIGAGYTWTFGSNGLQIPKGTANGVVIVCPTGTAQHLDFNFVWDE